MGPVRIDVCQPMGKKQLVIDHSVMGLPENSRVYPKKEISSIFGNGSNWKFSCLSAKSSDSNVWWGPCNVYSKVHDCLSLSLTHNSHRSWAMGLTGNSHLCPPMGLTEVLISANGSQCNLSSIVGEMGLTGNSHVYPKKGLNAIPMTV